MFDDLVVVAAGRIAFEVQCTDLLEEGWCPRFDTFRVDNETCYMIFVKEEEEVNDEEGCVSYGGC